MTDSNAYNAYHPLYRALFSFWAVLNWFKSFTLAFGNFSLVLYVLYTHHNRLFLQKKVQLIIISTCITQFDQTTSLKFWYWCILI